MFDKEWVNGVKSILKIISHDTVKYNLDIYINIALKKEIAN